MVPPMTNISEYTLASSHTKQSRLEEVSPPPALALCLPALHLTAPGLLFPPRHRGCLPASAASVNTERQDFFNYL